MGGTRAERSSRQKLKAATVRQAHIENHQCRWTAGELASRVGNQADMGGRHAVGSERVRQRLGNGVFILDDENVRLG